MIFQRWPVHPELQEYQMLYQWIKKLAEEYGVSYVVFCKNVLGLTHEEIGNLRNTLPENALLVLSRGTGVTIDELRKRDITGIFKMLYDELDRISKETPEEYDALIEKFVYKPSKPI